MLSFEQKCDSGMDRMTDTSQLTTAVFSSLYKLPKTVTVTMLLLIGHVMLLIHSRLWYYLQRCSRTAEKFKLFHKQLSVVQISANTNLKSIFPHWALWNLHIHSPGAQWRGPDSLKITHWVVIIDKSPRLDKKIIKKWIAYFSYLTK